MYTTLYNMSSEQGQLGHELKRKTFSRYGPPPALISDSTYALSAPSR